MDRPILLIGHSVRVPTLLLLYNVGYIRYKELNIDKKLTREEQLKQRTILKVMQVEIKPMVMLDHDKGLVQLVHTSAKVLHLVGWPCD